MGALLEGLAWTLIGYSVVVNTSFLVLTCLAAAEFVAHARRSGFRGYDDMFTTALTPPVSVLVPAYNESAGIVQAIRAMGSLRYPEYEVVVIDDGSTDGTLQALVGAFDLVQVSKVVPDDVPTRGSVEKVFMSPQGARNIVVIRKTNGGKSDALNTGINAARYPLVCMVDADSVLDPDALLHVTKPFAEDPDRVVASGGVVRAVNGCRVRAGRVTDVRMPRRWLARMQVVEYLRAFLIGRTGWSRVGALLIISGAFGVFRRDLLVRLGGMAHDCIGEDAELVVRLHRHVADEGRDSRVVFVAEPVAWTEVPESRAVLSRQRRRWQRGITEILLRHRKMIGRPRYGAVGLVAMPWFVLFEVLAPVVELLGVMLLATIGVLWVAQPTGIGPDLVDPRLALLLIAVSWGYALFLSVVALALEEFTFRRYRRRRDLLIALAAAVVENIGYRQLTSWWRIQGTVQAMRNTPPEWGTMTRTGFDSEDLPDPAATTQARGSG